MTAVEVFESVSQGGATDLADVIRACEAAGSYCLIGGLAVNCYVEPVYTMDADLVIVPASMERLKERLIGDRFKVEEFPHSVNAQRGGSQLRIQFTTDQRYYDFPSRAAPRMVLEQRVMVAGLDDVFQGKLWAWSDASRRLTKREKDRLDLLRLAEAHSALRPKLPAELRNLLP